MNRIDKKFMELRKARRAAFIAYVTAGDPSLKATERIILALEDSGADIVELGIPFSDPVADGPTIQAASQRALAAGVNLRKIFAMVRGLRRRTGLPLVFMTYYNPVLKFGLKEFFKECAAAGVDGVIIPDLSMEEAKEVIALGRKSGVCTIFLIAPTSPLSRVKAIASRARGFIYYVSLTGVTGARRRLPGELLSKVKAIKAVTGKPVAVGFGVSASSQARSISRVADGVIVGSAIVKIIGDKKDMISKVSKLARSLASAIHKEKA